MNLKKGKMMLCLAAALCAGSVVTIAQNTFQKSIGDFNYNDANGVQQTADKGYILVGTYVSDVPRIYVVKTDSLGVVTWSKTWTYFGEIGSCIQQAADGGYIIGAYYADMPFTTYILKLNAAGDTSWSRRIYNDSHDLGMSVMQTSDGNYVSAGVTTDGVTYFNARLTKFNSAGATVWSKGYTSALNYIELIPYCVKEANDRGYVSAGYLNNQFTAYDMVLMKTDSGGAYQWCKWYGANDTDIAYCVQPTSDNGFIMVGETQSFGAGLRDVYVVKTNSVGDTLWTRPYGGSGIDVGKSVVEANDGGYVIAGYTESFGAGMRDIYVFKVNSSGIVQWSRTFGGALPDEATSIQKTSDGGYIVAGYTESYGFNRDIYLVKLDSMGNSYCNQSDASTIRGMPFTQIGSAGLISGSVGSIAFHQWVRAVGGTSTPVCTVGLAEEEGQDVFTIYPNPSNGSFTISFGERFEIGNLKLEIFDVTGRKVYDQIINSSQQINHSFLPGIYFVSIRVGEKIMTQKLILE
jgi:hypothetical protein